jgi:hypothetical protein
MVQQNPDFFFFFYTCGVILWSEEYCSDEMPKCLIRKKCVVIWQLEHSCMTIDLVCFFFFFFCPQGLGIQGFYRQGFSLCYSSLIYVRGPTVVLAQYLRAPTKEARPCP